MARDEERLVEGASRGDTTAAEELLERNLPALNAYVRLRLGEVVSAKESCSDLVQSVCREVLRDIDRFEYRGEEAFRKWLFDRALHKVIDRNRYWRMGKRDVAREAAGSGELSDGEARALLGYYRSMCTPSRDAIAKEETARIETAFQQLDEPYREVIAMCRLLGLSQAEVAEQTGRSLGSVRGLLARGLAKFARLLEAADRG
ncbi:MAG: sigma-70 family RNA polymerase sigma factor [Planctomycetota bacterium]